MRRLHRFYQVHQLGIQLALNRISRFKPFRFIQTLSLSKIKLKNTMQSIAGGGLPPLSLCSVFRYSFLMLLTVYSLSRLRLHDRVSKPSQRRFFNTEVLSVNIGDEPCLGHINSALFVNYFIVYMHGHNFGDKHVVCRIAFYLQHTTLKIHRRLFYHWAFYYFAGLRSKIHFLEFINITP